MKKYILLYVITIFVNQLIAQDIECGNSGQTIRLRSQSEIDNFTNCNKILGNLSIIDESGGTINNLKKLISIKKIMGDLTITTNNNLNSLIGLDSLEYVGGKVLINSNGIQNFTGLNKLKIVGGQLYIQNWKLENFNGFDSLSEIGADFNIMGCSNLISSFGLKKLNKIGGEFRIYGNKRLKDFTDLNNLNSVGSLYIAYNDSLSSFKGFSNLKIINTHLAIIDNPNIVSLNGFENVNTINGQIALISNKNLSLCCQISTLISKASSLDINGNLVGCNNSFQIENSQPKINISYNSNLIFCEGDSVILKSSIVAGNIWSNGVKEQSITVKKSGSYSVTVNDGICSAISDPINVTVKQLPDAKITYSGSTNLPINTTINLSVTHQQGNVYEWYKDGSIIHGITSNYYFAKEAGNYKIKVTNSNCTNLSDPVEIKISNEIKPIITYKSKKSFCAGDSIMLYIENNDAIFEWLKNGHTIDGADKNYLIVKQSGIYSAKVTKNNFTLTTDTIKIIVYDTPKVEIIEVNKYILKNEPQIQLQAIPTGGIFYGEGINESIFNPINLKLGKKKIDYKYIDTNGCFGEASTSMIVVDSVGNICNSIKYDTVKVNTYDTITVTNNVTKYDTVTIKNNVYDTVLVNKTKYDTITVTNKVTKYDTITVKNNVYDTVILNKTKYDTITVTNNVTKYDTVIVPKTVTKYDTVKVNTYDTITVTNSVTKYDTVIVPKTVTKYDTVKINTYDTITVTNNVTKYDTVIVPKTVTKYDTVKVNTYDTITVTNNVTKYDTVIVPKTVTKYDTVKVNTYDTITVTNSVTKYDTVIVNQTKYDTITVTDTVNILKINFKLTTGIKANQMTSMSIYPNPTSDVLIIDASDLAAITGYSYRILDVLGKEVYNALVTTAKTEISLKTLGAKGMYVLHILDANKLSVQTKQIILE